MERARLELHENREGKRRKKRIEREKMEKRREGEYGGTGKPSNSEPEMHLQGGCVKVPREGLTGESRA